MNTAITCEECNKPHPDLVEVKVTAIFKGRTNEWVTHFLPKMFGLCSETGGYFKMAREKSYIILFQRWLLLGILYIGLTIFIRIKRRLKKWRRKRKKKDNRG